VRGTLGTSFSFRGDDPHLHFFFRADGRGGRKSSGVPAALFGQSMTDMPVGTLPVLAICSGIEPVTSGSLVRITVGPVSLTPAGQH
jgi:hypothetical protein